MATATPVIRRMFLLAQHDGRSRMVEEFLPAPSGSTVEAEFSGARWRLEVNGPSDSTGRGYGQQQFSATVLSGGGCGIAAGICWEISEWEPENYVLIPGAVYAGNRFSAERRPYPPSPRFLGQTAKNGLLDIGDLPRLAAEGEISRIDQLSWDAAIPGFAIFFPASKHAILCLLSQNGSHGPVGIEISENASRDTARIVLTMPGFLHPVDGQIRKNPTIGDMASVHLHPENPSPANVSAGDVLSFDFLWQEFPCEDLGTMFDQLFSWRKAMFPGALKPHACTFPLSAMGDLIEEKTNAVNWNEGLGVYQVGLPWMAGQNDQFWQIGWLGGGITSYALLVDGQDELLPRAQRNADFLFRDGISPAGYFKALMSEDGEWLGDGQGAWGGAQPWALTRRQGDGLFFGLRHLSVARMRGLPIPDFWRESLHRAARALVAFWELNRDFGYLLNYETGELVIGGSTGGALIPAALVLASREFGEPVFMRVAEESAEGCLRNDLARGVTTGGPGDAVQAPDGESVFALVESFILLYEETSDIKWLNAAEQASALAATWVMAYSYQFPKHSALASLDIDTRGVLLANAQNKCGVPGICTLSGQGLLRTFRASGDLRILDLLHEITHAIPQFVSTEERPIPARIRWGHPLEYLPPGWICERVNVTPSWPEPLGEQAAYSCWCEIAALLARCELPGIYAQSDTRVIRCLDHVEANWVDQSGGALRISNPTRHGARVRILLETSQTAKSTRLVEFSRCLPELRIAAGETKIF